MKTNKWLVLVLILIVLLTASAFIAVPSVRLSNSGHDIDVSYHNAELSDDALKISVEYKSAGEHFEIGRDIIVATDSDFTNVLQIKACKPEGGIYVYEYAPENLSEVKTLYIKSPILYVPTEISSVSVPLAVGKIAKSNAGLSQSKNTGKNWFTVESIDIEEAETGIYAVKVTVDAQTKDLPRFPMLVSGDKQYGGLAATYFDENDNFDYGEFIFPVPADDEAAVAAMVAESSLVFSDAMVRVDEGNRSASSDVKTISVVTE